MPTFFEEGERYSNEEERCKENPKGFQDEEEEIYTSYYHKWRRDLIASFSNIEEYWRKSRGVWEREEKIWATKRHLPREQRRMPILSLWARDLHFHYLLLRRLHLEKRHLHLCKVFLSSYHMGSHAWIRRCMRRRRNIPALVYLKKGGHHSYQQLEASLIWMEELFYSCNVPFSGNCYNYGNNSRYSRVGAPFSKTSQVYSRDKLWGNFLDMSPSNEGWDPEATWPFTDSIYRYVKFLPQELPKE